MVDDKDLLHQKTLAAGLRAVKGRQVNRIEMDQEMAIRMNLPRNLWVANPDGCSENVRSKVKNLIERLPKAIDQGVGIVIYGNSGVGKSSLASIIAKEARCWMSTVYFTSIAELRRNVKSNADFDDTDTVESRCRNVDVLVLDDLQAEDLIEKFNTTAKDISDLIAYRRDWKRMTILTSQLDPFDKTICPQHLVNAVQGSIVIKLIGENRRKEGSNSNTSEFLGE